MDKEIDISVSNQNPPQEQVQSAEQSPLPEKPSRFTKKVKIIIAIVIVIIIFLVAGIAGAYFYQSSNKVPAEEKETKPTLTPTPTPDPTADWKTYTRNDFVFRYPSGYSIDENSVRTILNRNIVFQDKFNDNSATECRGGCAIINDTQKISINTYDVKKLTGYFPAIGGGIPQSYISYEILNPNTNKYFSITLYELPQDEPFEDQVKKYPEERSLNPIPDAEDKTLLQILSTFTFTSLSTGKLTDSDSAIDTSGWKTYSESELSFNYPSDWILENAFISTTSKDIFINPPYVDTENASIIHLTVYDNPKNLSIKEWQDETNSIYPSTRTFYSDKDQLGIISSYPSRTNTKAKTCAPFFCYTVTILTEDKIYRFIKPNYDEYFFSKERLENHENVFENIISTIKIIE